MNKKIILVVFIILSVFLSVNLGSVRTVSADQLTDEIDEQLDNLNLDDLENFFNESDLPNGIRFSNIFTSILNGEYGFDFNGVKEYVVEIVFSNVKEFLPGIISIIAISIFALIMQSGKGSSEGVSQVVFWACVLSVFIILAKEIISAYTNTKNTIELLKKLIDIMSPIMMTLIAACGGKVSASIYSPAMTYLSSTVTEIFSSVVLPLTCVAMVLSFIGCFSKSVKVGKLVEFVNSLLKWIIGITLTVFTVFLSVQGIVAGGHDGVSLRVTKYALSNSIPLIGGFISGSMELVLAGSIIIKNTVGLTCVYLLFYLILQPIFNILTFSLILKFATGIIDTFSESKIPELCNVVSKCLTNFIVVILGVGFTFLMSVLLMVLSVGAFL